MNTELAVDEFINTQRRSQRELIDQGDRVIQAGQRVIDELLQQRAELLYALKHLCKEVPLHKFNIRNDFSLINAHAGALKAIHRVEGGES